MGKSENNWPKILVIFFSTFIDIILRTANCKPETIILVICKKNARRAIVRIIRI